ncbi:uncharacterized protein LOC101737697 [Bombyx mori]
MRLSHWMALAVLFGGTVTGDIVNELPPEEFDVKIGETVAVSIASNDGFTNTECLIQTPDGGPHSLQELDFIDVITEAGVDCSIKIKVTEEIEGAWTLISRATSFGSPVKRTLPFTINIVPGEHDESDDEKTESEEEKEKEKESEEKQETDEDDGKTIWLTEIRRFTRTEQIVDVSLPNIGYDEICTVITPDRKTITAAEIEIPGVKVQSKSVFVSCRISIGPLKSNLLGKWTLCGRRDGAEERRCQVVTIEWNSENAPHALWDSRTQPLFNHPVNLNGILTPVVIGSGSLLTCHIVTPNGEDLVVLPETKYPGIIRAESGTTGCSIAIGPITQDMLGQWELYGMFRSVLGLNEVRLPMNFELYDTDNPYNQAYNLTVLDAKRHVINLGSTISVEVSGHGTMDNCEFVAPSGQAYQSTGKNNFEGVQFVNVDGITACRISIGPITEVMLGKWQIVGKFNDGNIFNERQLPFEVIREDPANPIDDVDRIVTTIDDRKYDTEIGATHEIIINRGDFIKSESCQIRTPSGRQYTLMDGFNLQGIEIIEDTNVECGIRMTVLSEDMVGEWVLISKVTMLSDPMERRLVFKIHIEERVEPNSASITITEGNDLYLRLKNPVDKQDTCKLIAPNSRAFEIDEPNARLCGFLARAVSDQDSGEWEIQYGDTILYRAVINVNVVERSTIQVQDLTIIEGSKLITEIGPDDLVFCKLEDPLGMTVYEGFGRCVIRVDRATRNHNGKWKMSIGLQGRILLEELTFTVHVRSAGSRQVQTSVRRERPSVVISCSLTSNVEVRACKFRDPRGKVLIASRGVGEDRYAYHGSEVTYKSDLSSHECGIRLTNPSEEDLGLWRCGMETETETHYGFLPVICPWLLDTSEIQDKVVTEPILSADTSYVSSPEGQAVVMSCSVSATIQYCYFRAQNGTVFSVTPGATSTYTEYVGNGFAAGECGVRFDGLLTTDGGRWSCHVGLLDTEQEQRAEITLHIFEQMRVRHYIHPRGLMVEADVETPEELEYCRFVRIDGLGFTSENVPNGYQSMSNLQEGLCALLMRDQTTLNLHPWTVAAKVHGQTEIMRTSTQNLLWTLSQRTATVYSIYLFTVVMFILLATVLVGVSLGPKKNRKWTYDRVSRLSTNIRNSFRKQKPVGGV